MSSVEDKNLKAGHAPAVKAGGMRITQHRKTSEGDKTEMTPEEQEEFGTSATPKGEKHTQQVLVSGALGKGDSDFPADAIKQFHDKPLPAKEKRPMNATHNIQQPR